MPVGQQRLFSAYGWDGGYESIPLPTLVIKRAPSAQDFGVLGQTWLDSSVVPGNLYFMSANVAGLYTWTLIESSGSSGIFSSLVVNGPSTLTGTTNINTTGAAATSIATGGTGILNLGNATGNTAVTGSLSTTTSLSATTTVTAGTGIASTTGNIVATAGEVIAGGDTGGVASTTALTNASVAVAGGTGAFTITSATTSGTATNAGFIKMYVGTTAVFVPYYTTTA